MAASHSCPHFPSHHAFLLDFPAICIGCSLPFFVGCHSAARLGFTVTRSLTPSTTCLFEQWGHPIPLLLFPITASHSCPHVPFHQTFRLDPAVTCVGRRQLFFVGCHSAPQSRAHPSPALQKCQYPRSRHIPSPTSISFHGRGHFLQCEVVESYKRYSKKGLIQ